mmetsp:Transcript_137623/g.274541  ORF Transcript_137623/g.274541 Transcript_137623/m.274541 type:complete len:227 (+) Transcript_137623:29-709(+)
MVMASWPLLHALPAPAMSSKSVVALAPSTISRCLLLLNCRCTSSTSRASRAASCNSFVTAGVFRITGPKVPLKACPALRFVVPLDRSCWGQVTLSTCSSVWSGTVANKLSNSARSPLHGKLRLRHNARNVSVPSAAYPRALGLCVVASPVRSCAAPLLPWKRPWSLVVAVTASAVRSCFLFLAASLVLTLPVPLVCTKGLHNSTGIFGERICTLPSFGLASSFLQL